MKTFKKWLNEDAPVNAAGTGGVAGLDENPPGPGGFGGATFRRKRPTKYSFKSMVKDTNLKEEVVPSGVAAGSDVFEVSSDVYWRSKGVKHPRHRYSRYVGSDEVGEAIRQHGRKTKRNIMLKDSSTGAMTWLRRRGLPKR